MEKQVTPIKQITLIRQAILNRQAILIRRVKRLVTHVQELYLDRSLTLYKTLQSERGDVPGWVLVVLMTTGLVTGIWTLAAPRIDSILKNSLDSMNGIR